MKGPPYGVGRVAGRVDQLGSPSRESGDSGHPAAYSMTASSGARTTGQGMLVKIEGPPRINYASGLGAPLPPGAFADECAMTF
jgi:hypothetical protein